MKTPLSRSLAAALAALALSSLVVGAAVDSSRAKTAPEKNKWLIPAPQGTGVVGVEHGESPTFPSPGGTIKVASAAHGWTTDYAAALRQATAEKKQVLLNFTGSDWCPPCQRLDAEVFHKAEFLKTATERYVLVTLDYPRKKRLPSAEAAQNAGLQRKFNVSAYPTIIVLDHTGKKLAELKGYNGGGPKQFLAALERQARK